MSRKPITINDATIRLAAIFEQHPIAGLKTANILHAGLSYNERLKVIASKLGYKDDPLTLVVAPWDGEETLEAATRRARI